jgi:hypothetical protein
MRLYSFLLVKSSPPANAAAAAALANRKTRIYNRIYILVVVLYLSYSLIQVRDEAEVNRITDPFILL